MYHTESVQDSDVINDKKLSYCLMWLIKTA